MTDPRGVPARATVLILLALLLAGCNRAEAPAGAALEATLPESAPAPPTGEGLVMLPRPPILAATDPASLAMARLNAGRTNWENLYRRADADLVAANALPFLEQTAEGQHFLAAEGDRALARGDPAESCPATVVTAPPEPTPLEELVGEALSRCLAALRPRHPDCGCRLLAVNDFLTVPREEVSYATGTTARMRVPALGIDAVSVAEQQDGVTMIRDLRGPFARVARLPEGGVEVTLLRQRRRFEGRSIPIGYHRGRLAERIYATDPTGARMSLLIGFSPDDLAEGAAAWLAWPAAG